MTNLERKEIFGLLILMSLHTGLSKVTLTINRLEYEVYNEEIVTGLKSEMTKISRNESAPSIHFTLLRNVTKAKVQAELFQISGTHKTRIPLNIEGDVCNFIKNDFLIIKDLKKLGLTNCPLMAKEWVFEKITFDPKNLPNLLLIGTYIVKLTFSIDGKPVAMTQIYLTCREMNGPRGRKPIKLINSDWLLEKSVWKF